MYGAAMHLRVRSSQRWRGYHCESLFWRESTIVVGDAAYTTQGLIYEDRLSAHTLPVYECSRQCQCSPNCGNRVVQRGLRTRLQVVRFAWHMRRSLLTVDM